MKTITVIPFLFCLLFWTLSTAQMEQGNVMTGISSSLDLLGGGSDLMSVGISTVKFKSDSDDFTEEDPAKMNAFNLKPRVGYFFTDNLAVGLDLTLALSWNKSGTSDYKNNTSLIGGGPFVRYYFPAASVFPFVEASGLYGIMRDKYEDTGFGDETYKTTVISYGGGVGLAAPLGDNVTFDVMAGYDRLITKDKEDNDDNERLVFGTLGLKLGCMVYF